MPGRNTGKRERNREMVKRINPVTNDAKLAIILCYSVQFKEQ